MDPGNGFKLIFPRPEEEDNKYEKFLRKAHEIWQVTTGTMKANINMQPNPGLPKKKKKPKKKTATQNAQVVVNPNEIDPTLADGGDEGGGGETPLLD